MKLENLLPKKPSEAPLDMRLRGDAFARYVLDPHNGIKKLNKRGNWHFGAFVDGPGTELITHGAIVVGMLLRGEDVSELLPALEDYFNETEQLFLNSPGDTVCEYWYLMYVNALAMEIIKRKLLVDETWVEKFQQNSERLVKLAKEIQYDFDAQGYDFAAGKPFARKDAYRQPDAVAGYAYLMMQAFQVTNDVRYKKEAVHALKLYQSFEMNPWYEIPSGAMGCLAAAHLSKTNPDINLQRIVEFAFDPDGGCLHTGAWGDREVNGLMYGWRGYSRAEAASSAYSLESMVAFPFIAPIAKYAPQYGGIIGRYALNLAANLRWFYSDCLPADEQSRPDLSPEVPYEAVRRDEHGKALYACGDFHSHRSVYGGALSLWLGAIIQKTQDEWILQIDLTKTDFLAEDETRAYLYYNPHENDREISLQVGDAVSNVYDIASEDYVARLVTGNVTLVIPAGGARVVKVQRHPE